MSVIQKRILSVLASEVFALVLDLLLLPVFHKTLTATHFLLAATVGTPIFIAASFISFPSVEVNDDE